MTNVAAARTSTHGFLFADLRDYSAFVEDHGDHAAAELLARYRTLVRTVIATYQGAEVRTEGDSFYVVFPSASTAVFGGMAILAAAAQTEPPLRVGVGVHAGETADTGEGPVGSAVNIASRVCAQASAGELLATDTVRTLTRTLVPFRFLARGTPQLKGISEPIALYRVADPDDPEVAAAALPAATTGTKAPAGARPVSVRLAGLVAGIGVLAVVAIVLFVVSRGAGPSATSPPTSGLRASSSPAVPSLSPEQAALIARLPFGLQSSCVTSTPEKTATGATTSVTCTPAFGQGASSVTYSKYGTLASLLDMFQTVKAAQGSPGGDCATRAPASGPWTFGDSASGTFMSGSLLCYVDPAGQAQLVWTYESGDAQLILAMASRGDRDSKALYDWWFQVRAEVTR